ncbi:sigma 54 modulation/S30EA-like ribosomal protein [Flavobacterium sp. 270]|uniref:HPF/RaiA family ribosome-associated protein n=1 Tax=Flavobacterium sp. 270 TaxID=2512114 RepID=UPI001064A52B|nr:HPF/RaiA family ribosome-associated protein [Flavobacterium sp. 270]TDW49897.1 sigma 54 modulation/S30EA-like ribosomal protein [Flavobacterium sp. 270]
MKVQINTDKNIEGSARLESYFSAEIEKSLDRFEDKITRVEVHFGDENGEKFSLHDKKCVIEVRPVKLQPITVTEHSDTLEKAFSGALAKAKKALTTTFEKIKEH